MANKIDDAASSGLSRRRLLQILGGGSLAATLGTARTASAESGEPGDAARSPVLTTRLTTEYGVRYPFVGAGMGFVGMPALVAAVSNAGGIGVLGNAIEPPPGTLRLIQAIKASTDRLFGVDFIADSSDFAGPITTDEHIDVCIAEGVKLVVFHVNLPPRTWVDSLHAAGARVWMQAASVEQARGAVALGIDAVIAQGVQAGGHNKSTTRTLRLVREVVSAVHPMLVLAAGGIADGASAAEALSSGAEGVWVGTRLVASTEAYASDEYKRRIVAAGGHATALTTMFGPEYPGRRYRVLRNRVVDQFAGREDQIPDPPPPPAVIGHTTLFAQTLPVPYDMPKFSVVVPTPDTSGDFEEMGMPAGEDSVKLIKSVQPAREIVIEMMAAARRILEDELRSAGR